MRIVQIKDEYIEILRKSFPVVLDNKRFHRKHTRKYIGIVFSINNFQYYAPFSSPKIKDYNNDGSIKKSNLFSIRMLESGENGEKVLLGTIKLNNMIPIPSSYIEEYVIEDEEDEKYKNIVKSEFKWISEHINKIIKTSRRLYEFKRHELKNKNETNKKIYESIVPFIEVEKFLTDNKML